MTSYSLEKDVLDRFGYDDLMWVVVWGSLSNVQGYMQQHGETPLIELNNAISAANYMSYMAKGQQAQRFKQVMNALKEVRSKLYPNSWSSRLSNLGDDILEVTSSPFGWISNTLSEVIVELSTDTSIAELKKIDAAANSDDDLKVPAFGAQIEIVAPLLVGLKGYFQQQLYKIDSVIVSVQTELEKEYELQKRLNLIKLWDEMVNPLHKNNAIAFCDNVQQYLQQKNDRIDKEEILDVYLNMDGKKEMLFNAPQHRVEFRDALLEQAKTISYSLKNNR